MIRPVNNKPIHPAGHRYDPIPRPEGCGRIALVLQGGGALGAYQSYVYQALHEAALEPDWVSMPPKHVGVITHDVHREYEGR